MTTPNTASAYRLTAVTTRGRSWNMPNIRITISTGNVAPRTGPAMAYASAPLVMANSICGSVSDGSAQRRDQPLRMATNIATRPPSESSVQATTKMSAVPATCAA
jgi:hypothetical protein